MYESIVMALGGRVAEKLFLDDISTGASGDIQQASVTARNMVMRYGMSDRLGPILYDSSDHSIFIGRDFGTTKSYSEETAAIIDEEVKRLFDDASRECERILTEHREQLIAIAEYLLTNETMEGDEFEYYFEHGEFMPPKPAPAAKDDSIERPAKHISMDFGDEPKNEDVPSGAPEKTDEAAPAPEAGEETDNSGSDNEK
jgi:cell division protease FtsH